MVLARCALPLSLHVCARVCVFCSDTWVGHISWFQHTWTSTQHLNPSIIPDLCQFFVPAIMVARVLSLFLITIFPVTIPHCIFFSLSLFQEPHSQSPATCLPASQIAYSPQALPRQRSPSPLAHWTNVALSTLWPSFDSWSNQVNHSPYLTLHPHFYTVNKHALLTLFCHLCLAFWVWQVSPTLTEPSRHQLNIPSPFQSGSNACMPGTAPSAGHWEPPHSNCSQWEPSSPVCHSREPITSDHPAASF